MASKYIYKKKINIFFASLLDGAGRVFFKTDRVSASFLIRGHEKILLVRLDHIGDVLLSAPLAKTIKENFPNTKISFLVSAAAAPILQNNPFVDEILIKDVPWFARKSPPGDQKRSLRALIQILKEKKFDVVYGLRGDLRENLIFWLARIPHRIGYGITGGGYLLTREAEYSRGTHESEHGLDLLRATGIKCFFEKPKLYFSGKEETELSLKFAELLAAKEYLVGMQVDAGSTAKEWGQAPFQEFIGKLLKSYPQHKLLLMGTDIAKVPLNIKEAGTRIIDLVGKTTLREFAWISGKLRAFVGADSGPAHIAAAMGTPTVFLYSGTNVTDEWKPLYKNAVILYHSVACSPCGLTVCSVKGHPCMEGIAPDRVLEALKKIL